MNHHHHHHRHRHPRRNTNKRSARQLLPLLLVAAPWQNANAFHQSSLSRRATAPTTTQRSALPDIDPQELTTHAHALHGFLQHHSLILSDASAAIDPSSSSSGIVDNPLEAIQDAVQSTEAALESFEATEAAVAAEGGWWKAYLNIFKTTLEFVHSVVDEPIHKLGWQGGTWGFSIAIFTAGVRSLLVPLSFQQNKATELNKALKPYVDEINAKFKDNENRKNQLVGKLYEDAQQNPLSGCLLSLVQLPIILGLYRGVRLLALDGKLDESFLWIPTLQGPVTAETDYRGMDWLLQGWTQVDGIWTPSLGWETTLAFCIMPVILVLGQKLTMEALQPPEPDDDTMDAEAKEQLDKTKNILKFLPLLIGFFSLQVPAGLTIYWFTSNLFTLTQALVVRKYYEQNPPQIELPEYWDALGEDESQMSSEERRKLAKAGLSKGPSMEDWIAIAKFHTVVERDTDSLRLESEAWKKLAAKTTTSVPLEIPAEFQAWVDEATTAVSTSEEEANQAAEPVPQPTA